MSLHERLQPIRVVFGSKPTNMTAPRIALKKKLWSQSRTRISVTSARVHVRVNCVGAQCSVRSVQPLLLCSLADSEHSCNHGRRRSGKVRRRPRPWHVQGRYRLVYHLLLLLRPSSIACTLSGSNDQCDGNQCCPGVRGSRHRPFSCHQADACATLLLLVTVHLAAVPSPPGVEPAP